MLVWWVYLISSDILASDLYEMMVSHPFQHLQTNSSSSSPGQPVLQHMAMWGCGCRCFLPGLLLLLRVSILWCLLLLAARPVRCEFSSYATWANYLCAVEGADSSPFMQLLTDPQWPQLLMKQMIWRRSGVSSLTGASVPFSTKNVIDWMIG